MDSAGIKRLPGGLLSLWFQARECVLSSAQPDVTLEVTSVFATEK